MYFICCFYKWNFKDSTVLSSQLTSYHNTHILLTIYYLQRQRLRLREIGICFEISGLMLTSVLEPVESTTYYLLFTTYYLLLTIYYLLPTTYPEPLARGSSSQRLGTTYHILLTTIRFPCFEIGLFTHPYFSCESSFSSFTNAAIICYYKSGFADYV